MQSTDRFWTLLGAVLAGEFFFGILYAALVRWLSKKEVEGETAYPGVLGAFVSVAISIPLDPHPAPRPAGGAAGAGLFHCQRDADDRGIRGARAPGTP